MIEITLSGDEALQYIQNEKNEEARFSMLFQEHTELREASTIIGSRFVALQEKYDALLASTNTMATFDKAIDLAKSSRIEHDTELANDIESERPKFAKDTIPQKTVTDLNKKLDIFVTGTWTPEEVANIMSRLRLNTTNQDRSFKTLALSLNRSDGSLRAKLSSLGIYTKKGIIYKD